MKKSNLTLNKMKRHALPSPHFAPDDQRKRTKYVSHYKKKSLVSRGTTLTPKRLLKTYNLQRRLGREGVALSLGLGLGVTS